MNNRVRPLAIALLALLASTTSHAQKPVYKCMTNGKATYSNEPCLNAQEIDTTPTRGMDKSSGKSQKSRALQREELNEQIGRAVRPITGMDDATWKKANTRYQLTPAHKQECQRLDDTLAAERARTNRTATEEVELYKARKRYNDINC